MYTYFVIDKRKPRSKSIRKIFIEGITKGSFDLRFKKPFVIFQFCFLGFLFSWFSSFVSGFPGKKVVEDGSRQGWFLDEIFQKHIHYLKTRNWQKRRGTVCLKKQTEKNKKRTRCAQKTKNTEKRLKRDTMCPEKNANTGKTPKNEHDVS